MSHNKLDCDPAFQSPVKRVQRAVHDQFDRVIKPTFVGGSAMLGRSINAVGCSIVEFVKSLLSRS